MIIVDVDDVAADLGAYLNKVEHGETVVISIRNRPVAELRAAAKGMMTATARPFGLCVGEFVVPDDFDSPLPDEILADFQGR